MNDVIRTSNPNHAEVLALVKRLRDGGSTQDRIDAADALERFAENNDERLSRGSISSVASGPDGSGDDADTHTHMTLDFALKVADIHAKVDDVLEYRALAVLAAAVRAAQVHTADRCSSDETRVSPAEDFWMRLLADVNAEPCRWPGLRNELRDWQRTVRGSQKAREARPNDAFRWVCPTCRTVNDIAATHCEIRTCNTPRPPSQSENV